MSKERAARPLNAKSESKLESTHFGWLWFLNRNSISKCSIDWSIDLIVCDGRSLLMVHLEAIAFHVQINVNVILQSKIMMIFVLFLFFYLWKSPCERAIAWQHIALKEHNLSTPFSDFPIFHSLRQSTAEPIVLVCRVRPQEAPQNKWKLIFKNGSVCENRDETERLLHCEQSIFCQHRWNWLSVGVYTCDGGCREIGKLLKWPMMKSHFLVDD